MENKLFELTSARRAVCRLSEEPIREEILNEILRVALTAPSSNNHQPVEFVIVQDGNRIRELAACLSLGGSLLIGVDAVIAVTVRLVPGKDDYWIEDGTFASSYLMLAAAQYGLGAFWTQIRGAAGRRLSADEDVRELLRIPDRYSVLCLIALSSRSEQKQDYSISDADWKKLHYEQF